MAQAEGRTLVTLPPRGDLQPGDTLHILTGDRVIASALVIASGPEGVQATVVALSDLRRPVHPGDRVGTIPADVPPALPAAPSAAPVAQAETAVAPAVSPQAEAPATVTTTPEPAPHVSAPADAHPHDHTHPTTTAPATAVKPSPVAVDLTPEIRARLEAERAYWELSARILRLPSGGPELTALQQRLRTELAEMAP